MKKMKNIVCVLLAIAMCLGLTACGSGGAATVRRNRSGW